MCVGKAMSQVCKNVIIQPHEYPEAFRAIIRFSWWFGRSQPHPSGQLNHFTVFPKHYWLSLPPDLHCVTVKFSDKVSPDRGWDSSCLALFTDTKWTLLCERLMSVIFTCFDCVIPLLLTLNFTLVIYLSDKFNLFRRDIQQVYNNIFAVVLTFSSSYRKEKKTTTLQLCLDLIKGFMSHSNVL